jgi:predicted RNase H-like HicB family nuclease
MKEVILNQAKEIRAVLLGYLVSHYPHQKIDILIKEVTTYHTFDEENTFDKEEGFNKDCVVVTLKVVIEGFNGLSQSDCFKLKSSDLDAWMIKLIENLANTPFKYTKDDLLIGVNKDENTLEYCKVLDMTRELKLSFDVQTFKNSNIYKVRSCGVEKIFSEDMLFKHIYKCRAMMKYKGYKGFVEKDEEAGIWFGQVIGINDVITFKAETMEQARKEFEILVDDYLEFCQDLGEEPNSPDSDVE